MKNGEGVLRYRIAMALLRVLWKRAEVTAADKAKVEKRFAREYGIASTSIYREERP